MKESPITPLHIELGAVMSHADGWNMPAVYTDLVDEHLAARASCGIFDVSHLAKFRVSGENALPWLESVFSNSVAELQKGYAHQTLMLNHQGVIIDKVTLACESDTQFYVVGAASQEQIDENWLRTHLPVSGVALYNDTDAWCAIALQGPDSEQVFRRVFANVAYPELYGFVRLTYKGEILYLSRAGLFDEDGVDVYCSASRGIHWFETLLAAGAIPCGLKTRECMRLEQGLPSVAEDMGGLTPALAGFDSLCSENKNYIGSEVAAAPFQVPRRLVAIRCTEASGLPSRGDIVLNAQGEDVGTVTSAGASPSLHLGMAMAMIDAESAPVGTPLFIKSATFMVPAVVTESRAC